MNLPSQWCSNTREKLPHFHVFHSFSFLGTLQKAQLLPKVIYNNIKEIYAILIAQPTRQIRYY